MKFLEKLKPAQNLLLLDDKYADKKTVLKATLLDLLLKDVLRTKEVIRQPSSHDPEMVYTYITIGSAFYDYKYDEYEKAFLSLYLKNSGVEVLFRKLVKVAYEFSASQNRYYDLIARSFYMQQYFKSNLFQKLFGGHSYSENGTKAWDDLKAEIKTTEDLLVASINDNQKQKEIVRPIYGNIMLITGVALSAFALFDAHDASFDKSFDNYGPTGGCGGSGCGNWDSFSDNFDSGCGGHGHGGGCGGDSGCGGGGCSGCSGCGGGGCGGGD